MSIFHKYGLVLTYLLVLNFANSQSSERHAIWDDGVEDDIEESEVLQSRQFENVWFSNGIVNLTLTVPEGHISGIAYKDSDNILESGNKQDNRGYWDVVWNGNVNMDKYRDVLWNNNIYMDKFSGSSYKIVKQDNYTTEVSFTTEWTDGSPRIPLKIDKRFVLLKDSPGFYTYTVMEHPKGWPAFVIQEGRIVLKFQADKFRYMAMSDTRRRFMPHPRDRATGQILNYKEAVLLTNPMNPEFKGEVDDKYFYSCDNKDNKVHGWASDDIGVWMITPSNEFRTGGPFKQDLTSHVGPTMLNMFTSTHYCGEDLAIKMNTSEYWKMVWGPVYIYLNSDASAKDDPSKLWDDAKRRAEKEAASWPYDFPISEDFVKSRERGTVSGHLDVHDCMIVQYSVIFSSQNRESVPTASAYVGLARPGDPGSWQYENKGYQFWTQADEKGNFVIRNVIPGNYSLYAWVPGTFGDYVHPSNIDINPGSKKDVGNVVFKTPRNGATIWEIGIPDRSAAEFFIPPQESKYKMHNYIGGGLEKFRVYGLWNGYAAKYPQNDLIFTIGQSDYREDWFFAHMSREVQPKIRVGTTWQISFNLTKVDTKANYTLRLALAAAHVANLHVHINDPNSRPHLSTGTIGGENALARHGIHGLYHPYTVVVEGSSLVDGRNTIFLAQTGNAGFSVIMYDYIRFEGPDHECNS